MRVDIEAEPGELIAKAADLLKALAADLAPASEEARLVLDLLDDTAMRKRPLRQEYLQVLRKRVHEIADEELRTLEEEIIKEFAS